MPQESTDLRIHPDEVTPIRIDMTDDLAKLTAVKGSTVSLTGSPTVVVKDAAGSDVTNAWNPGPQLYQTTGVDLLLNPPAAAAGVYEFTVGSDHDGYAGAKIVGLVRDRKSGLERVVRIEVIS